jgi:ATP-dependent Clp protease adaptor protein ClpS
MIEMKDARGKCRSFNGEFLPTQQFELRGQCDSFFYMSAVSAGPLEQGSTSTVEAPVREKETKGEEELDLPWQVVVHNDPVNLMTYVTMVFQRVFGYPREKAERHMLEVHQKGRSILWSGVRERAEFYVQQLHGHLLLATLEKTN